MSRKFTVSSRARQSEILNNIYGGYYNSPQTRRPTIFNKTDNKIDNLGGIALYSKGWDIEMSKVRRLHRDISTLLTNIATLQQTGELDGVIYFIKRSKLDSMTKVVSAFNDYLQKNQLLTLRYEPLEDIKIPKEVAILG